MKLCPVDLAACDLSACRGGHCEMADQPRLSVCWECGSVDSHGIVAGICVTCIQVNGASTHTEEA